jgi:hypothetical protein
MKKLQMFIKNSLKNFKNYYYRWFKVYEFRVHKSQGLYYAPDSIIQIGTETYKILDSHYLGKSETMLTVHKYEV